MTYLRFILAFCWIGISLGGELHPIVLIPGDGGSQVEAKLNKTAVVHYICSKTSDWFPLWLNLELMIPKVIDCWADNMKLKYDPKTRKTRNNDGVYTRVPGFGNSSTVEYLDLSQRSFSIYFASIVTDLVKFGYERGANVYGAPYDFRKAPNEHEEFFKDYKALIERAYDENKKMKVIIICHSMGCPMTLYFLHRQPASWKDKYIRSFITLGGVWGGTVRAMKVFSVGDNLGTWILNEKSLMTEQRTSPSLAWLMPSSEFWSINETLIVTDKKNFTVSDIKEFYYAFNDSDAYEIWKDVRGLNAGLKPPGVEVFCLHGKGIETTEQLVYPPNTWPLGEPVLRTGRGDGTVNLRSLLGCTRWSGKQSQKVHHHAFNKTDHLGIIKNPDPINYVRSIVKKLNLETYVLNNPTIDVIP